ncbi:hypothetical protein [Geminisphaera colitermitum]|uniref:hypothetical protein n=1 Tax=Geminisphaera colitermitum TaxID=1148786 RepID=UPI0001965594|nr:hypothetical protein [Geminisphaera colitermitum]
MTITDLLERIRRDGVRRTAHALRKSPLPSRLLQELAALPPADAPEARPFVAAYSLSPSHLLEELADDALSTTHPDPGLLAHLATNPRTPPHLLTQFAAHADPAVRAQAAAHPQLPPRDLFTLATDPSPDVRRSLAANPSLRLPHQAILATDADPGVRLHLATTAAPQSQLALVLGADDSAAVRVHAVASLKVEPEILLGWAACDEEDVQLALFQRRELTAEVRRLLLRSPHATVRRAAVRAISADEADGASASTQLDDTDLFFLATRGQPDERVWVAGCPELCRPLQSILAQDTDPAIHAALAANPALDETIARYFVGRADETTCAALARNPAVPPPLIEELAATRLPSVLTALAYRDGLDATLAQFLIAHSPEFRTHCALLHSEQLTVNSEQLTMNSEQSPTAHCSLFTAPCSLSLDTARRLIADPLPTVRVLAVVACPDWRRADLYDIVRDPARAVRIAAIRHPNAPDELLSDWQADSDPAVAGAAREAAAIRATRPSPPSSSSARSGKKTNVNIDAVVTSPTLSPSPRATTRAAARAMPPAPPAAPDIFRKLKKFFWQ